MIAHFDAADWGTISDWVIVLATLVASGAAIYYILQNNAILTELKRQNDIASDPLLRVVVSEHDWTSSQIEGKRVLAGDSNQGIKDVKAKWMEHLETVHLPTHEDRVAMIIFLSNKGRSTITKVRIRGQFTVGHLPKDTTHLSSDTMSADLDLEVDEEINEGASPLYVGIAHVDNFPRYTFKFTSVTYSDARGKEHSISNLDSLAFEKNRISPLQLPRLEDEIEGTS